MKCNVLGCLAGLALCTAATTAQGAPPTNASPTAVATGSGTTRAFDRGTLRVKYGMRILGIKIGEPEVRLDPLESMSNGLPIRKAHFKAGSWGKLRRLYPFDTTAVVVLDARNYRPLRSVINTLRGLQRKAIDLRFKGKRIVGAVTEDGERKEVDVVYEDGVVDTLSSLIWLMARGLSPGETDQVPHHSGTTSYRLWFEAKAFEEVRVPAGTFEALPVVCTLYQWDVDKPAPKTRPTIEAVTEWTAWLERSPQRTPIKLKASVSILGDVVAELEARRFK